MPTGTDFNILIVDDEPDLLEIIALQLEALGYRVFKAQNGQVALDLIKIRQNQGQYFDAIMSDFNMPQMNGLVLLKEIRKLEFAVPFVFYTGFGDKEKALEALRLGALDFLDKPINPQEMMASLTRAAQLGRWINEMDQKYIDIGREFQVPEAKFDNIKKAQTEIFRIRALTQKK